MTDKEFKITITVTAEDQKTADMLFHHTAHFCQEFRSAGYKRSNFFLEKNFKLQWEQDKEKCLH